MGARPRLVVSVVGDAREVWWGGQTGAGPPAVWSVSQPGALTEGPLPLSLRPVRGDARYGALRH